MIPGRARGVSSQSDASVMANYRHVIHEPPRVGGRQGVKLVKITEQAYNSTIYGTYARGTAGRDDQLPAVWIRTRSIPTALRGSRERKGWAHDSAAG